LHTHTLTEMAGILGGKFLEWTCVAKPGSSPDRPEFYRPQDFAIGARIEVFKHKFIITDADEYVLKYMKAHVDDFPTGTLNSEKIAQQTPTRANDGRGQEMNTHSSYVYLFCCVLCKIH